MQIGDCIGMGFGMMVVMVEKGAQLNMYWPSDFNLQGVSWNSGLVVIVQLKYSTSSKTCSWFWGPFSVGYVSFLAVQMCVWASVTVPKRVSIRDQVSMGTIMTFWDPIYNLRFPFSIVWVNFCKECKFCLHVSTNVRKLLLLNTDMSVCDDTLPFYMVSKSIGKISADWRAGVSILRYIRRNLLIENSHFLLIL